MVMDKEEDLKRDFMRCLLARPNAAEAEQIAMRMVDTLSDMVKDIVDVVVDAHQDSFWHTEDEE
jgi:leucyl aminopeptidase (aminopeptidase T)